MLLEGRRRSRIWKRFGPLLLRKRDIAIWDRGSIILFRCSVTLVSIFPLNFLYRRIFEEIHVTYC